MKTDNRITIASRTGRQGPPPDDPLGRRSEMRIAISMASVKKQVQSWLKKSYPRKKFDFIHLSGGDASELADRKSLLKFLKEKSAPHEIIDPFGHNHLDWVHSQVVMRKRNGGLDITNPVVWDTFSIDIEWQRKRIVVFKLSRLEDKMEKFDLLVCAVEDLESFKEFMRELVLYRASRHEKASYIECYSGRGHRDKILREKLRWDDIILPGGTVGEIRADIESFFANSGLYKKMRLPYKRGIILTGSPGNGKTLLCRVIASNFRDIPFAVVQADKNMDNGELDFLYSCFSNREGAIICIEDLDTIFEKGRITLSAFLNILDGIKPGYGILTIATTNNPGRIDPALTRRPSRFDRKWVIREPDEEGRRRLLRLYFRDDVSDVMVQEIAAKTDGWSAAYLKELFITAGFISVRHLSAAKKAGLSAKAKAKTSDGVRPEHIRRAFEMLDSQRTLEKRNFNPAASTVGFAG